MKLFVAICQNGLGHFVRVTRILDALLEEMNASSSRELSVTVAAGSWQWQALANEGFVSRVFSRVDHIEIGEHPLRLSGFGKLTPDKLRTADESVFMSDACQSADLVWSDNLTSALRYCPRTILSGSFLWGAVLRNAFPDHVTATLVADEEASLLRQHNPEMICVEALCMTDVIEQTRAIACGLMTEPVFEATSNTVVDSVPKTIGLFGGATGLARDHLIAFGTRLKGRGHEVLSAPSADLPFAQFGFADADWASLDVVYCRPGLGTIHDCARHGLPMILAYNQDNIELRHNATRIVELGLGADASHLSEDEAEKMLMEWASRRGSVRARFRELAYDGIGQAARAIKLRLEGGQAEQPRAQAGSHQ